MSSFYSTIFVTGLSGSTGPTGPTGPKGPVGATGPNAYGSTGSSIVGITLDSIKRLLFTFEDGSTASSSPIVSGATGSWQARISGQGTNTVFSSSVQGSSGDFIVLKNFKTDTPESIGITLSDDRNSIVINYISTLGGTFTQSELNRLVIGSGTGISSANITNYDTVTKSLDIKIDRYLEGITNVYPENNSGASTSRWDLNTDLYSIFNLQPETTINTSKIININSTANDNISRGITVIIPSGITASAKNIEFRVNEAVGQPTVDVLFPMTLNIRLTDKLEVVNMISMGKDKWYGSFALWNNDSDININAKTPVFDLLNTGDPVNFGPWFSLILAAAGNSCITQSNSSDIYERPCIQGGSSSGGGGGGNACLPFYVPGGQLNILQTTLVQQVDSTVVTNPKMRAAITATGLPWKVNDTQTGMDMVLIPGGTFIMGSVPSNPANAIGPGELPQHEVVITLPFYMSIHEVTQTTWVGPGRPNNSVNQQGSVWPVENLTKAEILEFLAGTQLHLPTEAEWEYACRGGYDNQNTYSANVDTISWNKANSNSQTHEVMEKLANPLGLYDMLGNVFEYTYKCPPYTAGKVTDPVECPLTSNPWYGRGGSYNSDTTGTLNASNRAFSFYRDTSSSATSGQFGFRVIRRIKP
jgi:formylglycine-generating enzyme required for sulfatase activity